jgi:hypothetical protein
LDECKIALHCHVFLVLIWNADLCGHLPWSSSWTFEQDNEGNDHRKVSAQHNQDNYNICKHYCLLHPGLTAVLNIASKLSSSNPGSIHGISYRAGCYLPCVASRHIWGSGCISYNGRGRAGIDRASSSSAFALAWRNHSPRSITPPRFYELLCVPLRLGANWGYWPSDSVFDQGGGVHHKLLMFLTWMGYFACTA